jgi:hypothetical protein
MIILPAEQKIGAKVEVLLPAMACDVRRICHSQAPPQFVTLVPGSDLLNIETGHREMEGVVR